MPASASPDRADLLRRMCAVTLLATGAAVIAALLAPADTLQGNWQRLMYVHVPAAWTAFACFFLVLVASVCYLRTRSARWDRCAAVAAELGVIATAVTLLSGAVWGAAIWGTWWTWDPRLVSTAALGATYLGYIGLRGIGPDEGRARRRAAWLGISGFAWVPVVHFSVVWWRSLHQEATFLRPGLETPPIDPRMGLALVLAVVAASSLAAWVLAARLTAHRQADDEDAPQAHRRPVGTR